MWEQCAVSDVPIRYCRCPDAAISGRRAVGAAVVRRAEVREIPYAWGGLVLIGKAAVLKTAAVKAAYRFESCALRSAAAPFVGVCRRRTRVDRV